MIATGPPPPQVLGISRRVQCRSASMCQEINGSSTGVQVIKFFDMKCPYFYRMVVTGTRTRSKGASRVATSTNGSRRPPLGIVVRRVEYDPTVPVGTMLRRR